MINNDDKKRIDSFNFNAVSIPAPLEKINRTKKWVEYGSDNLYPLYLISLSNKSSLHAAILKQKSMLIGGGGFAKTNLSPEAMLFIKNIYNDDDLDEILFKIALDLELYGGFYLNIIWSKDGEKISEINYIDPSKVRIAVPDEKDEYPQIENYWISDGWENVQKYPPTLYPGFSTVKKEKRSQILYVKEYRPGTEWYARPEYEPGVRWIELEWEISNFHLNNVKNGFHPSMHINFPIGQPSNEEAFEIIKRLKAQYQGTDMAGNVMVTFSDNKDTAVSFDPIELNTTDARFLMLNEQVTDGILKAHRVTNPALFGIETPGALGSRNEMLESLEIFQTQYTSPKQRLIEKIFNWLRRINGIKDQLIINTYQPQFSKLNTNLGDILNILQSTITEEQKYYLLLQNDYDAQTAMKLSGFTEGRNLKNIDKVSEGTPSPQIKPEPEVQNTAEEVVNDNIKNLTAKQHQQMMRIIRQYSKGQLTEAQATTLLKTSLGLSSEDIKTLLGIEEDNSPLGI